MSKCRALILTGRYLPGYKDGGPVRSILNLTEWFGDSIDIRIMCLDRDHGDKEPYPDIVLRDWNEVGKARVWYTESFNARDIAMLSDDADIVYCCGPYSDYSIAAMRLKKNGRMKAPLYVASMGSFSPEAFAIKGKKKEWFVKIMKLFGMFDNVIWSVTSEREEQELKDVIGSAADCVIASDLARKDMTEHIGIKETGSVRLIFLSRISRKKNLAAIPDILELLGTDVRVSVDIYGIPEDEEYLDECRKNFAKLPDNITWEYKGEIESEMVPAIFANYDAFIFPTLGENYGHVIAESLSAGCIPIISNTTPWLDFNEKNAGYVCDIDKPEEFATAIRQIASMDESELLPKRTACYEYIGAKNAKEAEISGYRRIFEAES